MCLLVTPSGCKPLLGRNWLHKIQLQWHSIFGITKEVHTVEYSDVNGVLEQYASLFDNVLGCYRGTAIELTVSSEPKFHKARPVPYAIRDSVEKELNKMVDEGVLKRVSTASCAAPIVAVPKKYSEQIRVCGDFSVTYNSCADVVQYPIPRIEDLHSALQGCNMFSVLDMSQAYHQLPIVEDSQKYLTINTHCGLFQFTRMPNGIHSGPALFQRTMDSLLSGIPGVTCYLDDILVAGKSAQEHYQTLACVFEKLQSAGFKLNKSKCKFEQFSVTYLGHVIDDKGLHPTREKLDAIRDAPAPKDVTALKSFLGLLMFYSRFLSDHATVLAPLNNLLRKSVKWKWTNTEQRAFNEAKKLILESKTLVHYNPALPIYLSCDASSYGAGAVLSHKIDGEYRPISFASCSLTDSQRNYSQIEKEAFSIIFRLKRFHQYIYGRTVTIITDHKPLLSLFAPDRAVPLHVAAKLQRWSLILASYKYVIEYRNTDLHKDADCMSRIPLSKPYTPKSENSECLFIDSGFDVTTNVTSARIRKCTRTDPVLSQVYNYVVCGWPTVTDPIFAPYKNKKDEFSAIQGCVLWGSRVIIPKSLQSTVLEELHCTHPGMTRMKELARSYIWWPNLNVQIEQQVSKCETCQAMRKEPPKAQIHPWSYPAKAWSRVHIDYAGPVNNAMYLVIVDAYSKFPEVVKMSTTTSIATIQVLREIFARYGLPEILVSDNGPQFKSVEFEQFCVNNGILHTTSAIYKPATNGQAERVVQILKAAIKRAKLMCKNADEVITDSLQRYRVTPHGTTGEAPSMLFFGRRIRTRLDLLVPSVNSKVERSQNRMISSTDRGSRNFETGDAVLLRNFSGVKWKQGIVNEKLGNRHYLVDVEGEIVKRHIDQLLKREETVNESVSVEFKNQVSDNEEIVQSAPCEISRGEENVKTEPVDVDENANMPHLESNGAKAISTEKSSACKSVSVPDLNVRPSRERKPPGYLKDYVPK